MPWQDAPVVSKTAAWEAAPLVRPKARARVAPQAATPNPTEGSSFGQNMLEGYGGRTVGLARRVGNALTPQGPRYQEGHLTPTDDGKIDPSAFQSAESIRAQDKLDAPLNDTGGGKVGGFAADVVNTLPAGVANTGTKILGQAAQRGPALVRALGGALASRPGQAAVEGGLVGSVTGDPENRGEESAKGSVLSGALSLLGKGAGRVLRGVVTPSAEAELLNTIAGQHGIDPKLPLAQAAQEGGISGAVKNFYGKILPLIPGAPRALKSQEDDAMAKFREIAMREAAPPNFQMPGDAGKDVHTVMGAIEGAFSHEYANTVKAYSFNAPQPGELAQFVQQMDPGINKKALGEISGDIDNIIERYSNGSKVLTGENLTRAKTALAKHGQGASDEQTSQAFFNASKALDGIVEKDLRQGGDPQNIADLERYLGLAEPYRNFLRVQKAAAYTKKTGGEFTDQDLKRSVLKLSREKDLAKGTGAMQDLADVGQQTVGQPGRYPGFIEKAVAWGGLGGLGALSTPVGAAALMGGARTLASRPVQEGLMGQLSSQKNLARLIRENPGLVDNIGRGARLGTVRQFGSDNASQ